MKQEKKCLICNNFFQKKPSHSKKNWLKAKFCSVKCTNISFIGKPNTSKTKFVNGQTPFNKGKKFLQITGSKHPMWKGGRLYNRGGFKKYIEIYNPEHPYANSLGYVREHRLVMEKHLGRYLEPEEVVHHINELRDDNRLENLQLFANNQLHSAYHCLKTPKLPLLRKVRN